MSSISIALSWVHSPCYGQQTEIFLVLVLKINLFLALPEFIVGEAGKTTCPRSTTLVTDKYQCFYNAPNALRKPFGTEKCHRFSAVGCFTNGDVVAYSNCSTLETVGSHSPVCKVLPGILFFSYYYFC